MPVQLMLGSLVGVPMEVDKATLHRSDYCRIQLGCRDIEKLPPDAKGILIGDYFHTFAYELESLVMKGPPVASSLIRNSQRNTSSDVPSPRKPRCDNTTAESSERQTGNSHNASYGKNYCNTFSMVDERESMEESEEGDDLLINFMARENQ
jgi:hypothetical protein